MQLSAESYLDRLRKRLPRFELKLTSFPSGSFMIDVAIAGDIYVVESVAERGFGVSRRSTAVFGWEGVERAFKSFEEVEAHLLSIAVNDGGTETKA